MASLDCINLHLIGKQGSGRSMTGNSILGRKAFRSSSSASANRLISEAMEVKDECLSNTTTVLRMWDWPGMNGSRENIQAITEHSRTLAGQLNAETHFLLWVLRYGELCDENDEDLLKIFTTELGQTIITQNTIIILTHKDNFESDVEESQLTFHEWLKQQGGVFQDLYQMCNGRVLFFDNKGDNPNQLKDLFVLIARMLLRKPNVDQKQVSPQPSPPPPTGFASAGTTPMESQQVSCVESSIDEFCGILGNSPLIRILEKLAVLLEKLRKQKDGNKKPVKEALMREIERHQEELIAIIGLQKNTYTYVRDLKEKLQHEAYIGRDYVVVEKKCQQTEH